MFLVLVVVCCSTAQAQRYYIPKYKRERTVVESDMHKQDRKWTITISSSYNMSLGMQNRIAYRNLGDVVRYDEAAKFHGVTAELGIGRKVGSHIIAGLSTGFDYTNALKAIPVRGTFRYYYGQAVAARRHRWFSYVELGPQFYMEEKYKTIGAAGVIGGGIRVLVLKSLRLDFQVGYRNTLMRRPINRTGSYALDEKDVNFQQYMHTVLAGFNLTLF